MEGDFPGLSTSNDVVNSHNLNYCISYNNTICTLVSHQRDASIVACYYRDEPDFNLLASFFGLYNVKDEIHQEVITISDNSVEVILLSDSDVPNAAKRVQPNSSPPNSDEVTSPMPVATKGVGRMLFAAEVPSFTGLHSSSSPPRFNAERSTMFSSPKG